MDINNATEIAYKNGYEQGMKDAVKHGRWVHKSAWHIECSECCHVLAHIGEAKNYCPSCGDIMDGGDAE